MAVALTACAPADDGSDREVTGAAAGSSPGPRSASPSASASGRASPSASPSASGAASAAALPQLPRGGRTIFPTHTVVAHYGTAGSDALGVLGRGTPQEAAERLERAAAPFAAASGRPVLPALELVATVAQRDPGPDGDYSVPLRRDEVQPYLDAARAARALLVLDLQPGRADLLAQARLFEDLLREPDVGLAVDPEWKLLPTQTPGDQVGTVGVEEVNRVSRWLAELRAAEGLPEKLFVVHQFRPGMVRGRERLARRSGLATVVHVDGFGTPEAKRKAYAALAAKKNEFANGFKLFYREDTSMMSPRQVMALRPRPQLVTYQ